MSRLRRAPILLGLAGLFLLLGIWGPGLWDPWEMNRTHLARRMAEAPMVLVAEARARSDAGSLASLLAQGLSDDAEVVSTADRGSVASPLDAARTLLADHVFAVAVMDVDALWKRGSTSAPGADATASEEAARKRLAETMKSLVLQNRSTVFLWVSGTGGLDPKRVTADLSSRLASSTDPDEDGDEVVSVFQHNHEAVSSPAALADAVRRHLGADAFFAQFKSKGWTQFAPPLDPFLVSLSLRAFGMNEFAARLPGVLLAVVLLATLFVFVRRVFGPHDAEASMLVLMTSGLFYLSARFVDNEMSVMLGLSLGVVALERTRETGTAWRALWLIPVSAFLYLAGGMTAVVTLALIAVAWPLVLWESRRETVLAAAVAVGCTGLLALLTFVPDAAFFRSFRFTQATFAGGMRNDARTFDFILKEIGFGVFPWSALLPLSLAAVFRREEDATPSRTLVLLWAAVPAAVAMVTIRPMNQTLYAGAPALAVLVALYLREAPSDAMHRRLLAFFGFGLFLVMIKDLVQSPASLVSFLTTDPMFSEEGKGDLPFPPAVRLPLIGLLGVGIAGAILLLGGARLLTAIRGFPQVLERPRTFRVALFAILAAIVADIAIFLALKWDTLRGAADPDVAVGAVLLRIFLTGPDIAALYLALAAVLIARRHAAVVRALQRVAGPARIAAISQALDRLERPAYLFGTFGAGAFLLFAATAYLLGPELSYHLSQKHIIQTYQESSARLPGELFRHGTFVSRGSEDSNFYTGQVPEMTSRTDVVTRLLDPARRTFFIVPKSQWSEVNHAVRSRSGGRPVPVLDDRSSRFILVASSLAAGEEDHNWLAQATLTESQFKALTEVTPTFVNFDDKVHLVGYSLSSHAVRRGGKVTIRMYFKTVARVSSSYRIFMHVDRIGSSSRIHGDHFILNLVRETEDTKTCQGCFATNHWLPGDIVVDTYDLEVPIGSPSGPHQIWMGLYNPSGDQRMPVKDYDKTRVRHDGQNRAGIGLLTVE